MTCPANGIYVKEFTINAAEIVELVEAPNENVGSRTAAPPLPTAVPRTKTFEDPAILSVGKRPTPANHQDSIQAPSQWDAAPMQRMDSSRTVTSKDDRGSANVLPALSLVEPMQQVHIAEAGTDALADALIQEELGAELEVKIAQPAVKRKRTRRRKGREAVGDAHLELDGVPAKETVRSKGWRQTPLLEPNPSFQPFATLKRKGKANRHADESGWGTEDATDVQDMGDFDFAGSLAKFDKKSVFTQIQAEDEILDEDRLVAHNRVSRARPGTAGGKNLHYTENVLDVPNGTPKVKSDAWKSEAGDSDMDERASQKDSGRGRQSRRADSKLSSSRRPVSRKGSSTAASIQPQPARTLSVSDPFHSCRIRIAKSIKIPTPSTKPSFYLVPSDRRCEPISALQMLNLENIADNELGLSEDMMTENAGRGIAEVALSALNTGGRGLTQGKSIIIPTVVAFAGNNKSGLRAVAAARHLRNHGLNVVVCVLSLERETELLVGLRRQLKVFRHFGGKLVTKVEVSEFRSPKFHCVIDFALLLQYS